MTATILFERLRQLKPIPAEIDDTILLDWLNQVEGQILHEIFLLALSEITPYSATPTEALAAPYPYDGIYMLWMEAQVDFANGEYERYTNTMQRYNTAWNDLARHIAKCIRPVYGRAVEQGYYLSAYGIAKAHGYTGTEAEWLASLKGAAGAPGKDGKPFHWRGAWDASTSYAKLDAVEHNGSCYVWTDDADSTAGDEPGVDELWELCAAKGAKGDTGPQGPQGPAGSGGSAELPPVLGNLAAQIGDAAAGTIPVYAGDEAWTIEKLITEYNEDTPLSGYIPDTAWVAAYMAAQKELLKLLPDSAAADAGKLLQVGANGNAAWGDKLPTSLKNPKALTFTGTATGTYDGSEALTVDIPSGGGVSGDVTNIITYPLAQRYEVSDYYKYVSYTQATLNADGTLNESGIGFTTDYLPVIPGETLFLSTTVTQKVAFFSGSKEYIGQITVASGQTNYTVPENAALARFQNEYNGGQTVRFECREKPQQGITRLKDLIFSPLHSSVDLLVTGDSNTYGYGLSDRENEGWAYLLAKMLATITEIHVGYMSPYAHALAYSGYANGANFRPGSRLALYTDAQSVTLNYDVEYSGTWKWYVNDVEQAETEKTISVLGDGVKKVEVRFTGGQIVNPNLSISKTITVTNNAIVGCGIDNCPIEAGHDWLVLMIGTNNRNVDGGMVGAGKTYLAYAGKGTYIVPFPNRKTDASYVASQARVYGELTSTLRSINYEICDASDFGYAFIQDNSLYQSDMIHYSTKGHKAIANIVGGKLGFPVTAL